MSEIRRFRAMGCDLVVCGATAGVVEAVFERWEGAFSLYRPGSELSRVNASPDRVQLVSPRFQRALRAALDAAEDTGGLVDPTLGAGLDRVRLAGRLLHRPPGLRLDLNGVVKALAVDEAAAALPGDGFVSAGGDLAVRGPVDVGLPRGGAVRVVRGGMATSGVASRGEHLVDPARGAPSRSPWEQVTVAGATCLAADVAAKAAFLLGAEGPGWLDERALPGRFVGLDGAVVVNDAWRSSEVPACT